MSTAILVVDDDALVNDFLVTTLRESPYEVDTAFSAAGALEKIAGREYDLVISDVRMPGMDGLALLERIRTSAPDTVVVIMTAFGEIADAVRAMKAGAFEYLVKPVGADVTDAVVARALEFRRLKVENRVLREAVTRRFAAEQLIGQSAPMKRIFDLIDAVATSRATVLITGESGTGKELVARAIHYRGTRRQGPFEAINCAALPETLFESSLFGHEKGAFTGAVRAHRGLFETADAGTLLLDEISEIPTPMQAKLLRVLQEREIQRLGSDRRIPVDVRMIATTNRHIPTEIAAGNFREDLFYRLNVVAIDLPPLRDRLADIPALIELFIHRYNAENGRSVRRVSDAVLRLFERYRWPGNVRELENFIERAIVVAGGDTLTPEDFPRDLVTDGPRSKGRIIEPGLSIYEMEKALILATLEAEGNNQTKASDKLGISSRTLRNKLYEYGLKTPGGGAAPLCAEEAVTRGAEPA
ncbi:MAG: sigma-54-dependent Fis family transcriptional regulator [candidate division Zixibacteria bacterium]|nr:sigma-54-dependent Fis family transcriptional regulator [candidate division Zixibacteria bacterium]